MAEHFDNVLLLLLKDAIALGALSYFLTHQSSSRIEFLHNKMDEIIDKHDFIDVSARISDDKVPEKLKGWADEIDRLLEAIDKSVMGLMGTASRLIPMSEELADSYNDTTQNGGVGFGGGDHSRYLRSRNSGRSGMHTYGCSTRRMA